MREAATAMCMPGWSYVRPKMALFGPALHLRSKHGVDVILGKRDKPSLRGGDIRQVAHHNSAVAPRAEIQSHGAFGWIDRLGTYVLIELC